jgi:hypothetical protein
MAEKTKEERVKEGINLLMKLKEVGISPTDPSYREVQEHISDWVKTGDPWIGKVEFYRYGRIAEILLPRKATAVASLALKMKPGFTTDE